MTRSTDAAWPSASKIPLAFPCLTGLDAPALVEPLFREYLRWVVEKLGREDGVHVDVVDSRLEHHHQAFSTEMLSLMGHCGRLLLARLDDVAEVKRMYVRALARGPGVGRLLLQRLVADARAEGYRVVQLETLSFMTEACPLPFARFRRDGRP